MPRQRLWLSSARQRSQQTCDAILNSRVSGPCTDFNAIVAYAQVDEAKKAFQAAYGRPVGPTAQGFVSELLQSTCFAIQTPSYEYSRIFAVGYEALCKEFLQGCPNDADREALKTSMAYGLGMEYSVLARDAESLTSSASSMSEAELLASKDFKAVADKGNFKYTYTFGAGIIALMGTVGVEPGAESIDKWCGELSMGPNVLKRDYDYYKTSVEKMSQVKDMMLQMQVSAKKAEAKRLAEKAEKAAKEADAAEEAASADESA